VPFTRRFLPRPRSGIRFGCFALGSRRIKTKRTMQLPKLPAHRFPHPHLLRRILLNLLWPALLAIGIVASPASLSSAPITSGQTVSASIFQPGGSSEFEFAAFTGENVTLVIGTTSGTLVPWLELHSPSGRVLKSNSVGPHAIDYLSLPEDGTYRAVVRDQQESRTGLFNLTLAKLPGSQMAQTIANGATRSSDLLIGDLDLYTLEGTKGERIQLKLLRTSGTFSPLLDLYGPHGELTATAAATPEATIDLPYAPAAGTYTAVVRSREGGTGLYSLTLQKESGTPVLPPTGTRIRSGELLSGRIAVGEERVFTAALSPRDYASLHLGRTAGTFYPRITIHSPTGKLVANQAASSSTIQGVSVELAHLEEKGIYSIRIGDTAGTRPGEYVFSMGRFPGNQQLQSGGTIVTSGQTVSGAIAPGQIIVLPFLAEIGDSLIATLGRTGGTFYPHINLYGPDGRLLAANNTTSSVVEGTAVELLHAPESGTYYAVARDSLSRLSGTYAFTLARLPSAQDFTSGGKRVRSGQTETGSLAPGKLDILTFGVEAGDSITVAFGRTSGNFYPALLLFGPDGRLLERNQTTASGVEGTAVDLLNAPQTGTYYAVAKDRFDRYTGTYSLTLSHLPGPQDFNSGGGTVTSGQLTGGFLAPGKIDIFTLRAVAGENISLTLTRQDGQFYPRIDLYTPTGEALASNHTTSSVPNVISINLSNAPFSGTYYAVIRDHLARYSGAYTLALTGPSSPAPPPAPTIIQINPDPVIGKKGPQPLNIHGSYFGPTSTVTLHNLRTGQVFPAQPISEETASTLTISADLSRWRAEWTVEVIDLHGQSSGEYPFEVSAPAGFPEWAAAIANASQRGADQMPFGDGVSNLLKYAFDLDPNQPATQSFFLPRLVGDGSVELPFEQDLSRWDVTWEIDFSDDQMRSWDLLARASGDGVFQRVSGSPLILRQEPSEDPMRRTVKVVGMGPPWPEQRLFRLRLRLSDQNP
jgi:hypothetical protein